MTITSRTRIVDPAIQTNTIECWWTVNAIKSNVSTFVHPYHNKFDGMSDFLVSDYKKRVARGEMFFNPMQRETSQISYMPTVQQYRTRLTSDSTLYGGQWYFALPEQFSIDAVPLFGTNLDAFHALFDVYADLCSQAVTSAYADVDQSELLGLASIGEMPETVSWITSVLKRVVTIVATFASKKKILAAAKSARKLTAKDYTDAVSDLWLELRYAVRPLMFEAKQALEALQKAIKRSGRFTARGYIEDLTTSSSFLEGYNANITHKYAKCIQTKYKARAGVSYTILDDTMALLSHWGLDQPLEAIYELLPGSFIIDWFFNVGSVISSWSINASLGILGSYVTETIQILGTIEHYGYDIHSPYYLYAVDGLTPGYAKRDHTYKRRVISPDRVVLPSLNIKLDVAKIIDLVTIGRNFLR